MMHVLNIGVPRTGTVYIQQTLSNVRPHGHYHFTQSDWSHIAFKPIPAEWQGDFKVGVVRNPFDLLVSNWSLLRRMDVLMHHYDRDLAQLDFRSWLDLITHRQGRYPKRYPLHFQYFTDDWQLGVDYLARFETLNRDLTEIAALTGGIFTPKPPVNTSKHGDWRVYYDEPMRQLVEETYYADLTYFGYSRDGVDGVAMTTFGRNPRPLKSIGARSPEVPWEVKE